MKIETKFNIGDIVYPIIHQRKFNYYECNICGGTGIFYVKGENFTCPKCKGNKRMYDFQNNWQVACSEEIIEITVIVSPMPEKEQIQDILEKYHFEKNETALRKNVFATQSEAIAECEKRNNV